MSLASKITFGACCVCSASIVAYVHLNQDLERERLRKGVIRDIESQQRKAVNILQLTKQQDLKSHIERFNENELNEAEVVK